MADIIELGEIEWFRGDTDPLAVIVTDSDGNAVDITGWTFVLTVNKELRPTDDTNQVFTVDGSITDAAAGAVEFRWTEDNTNQLGGYYYDIQRVNALGYKKTMVLERIIFTQDLTKT